MNGFAVFKLQGKRLLSRIELRFALAIVLAITTVAFIESCLHFYGGDAGALPSAAYGWAWNMDRMQIQAMRVLAFFLIFIVAAVVFADSFLADIKSGVALCIASRCPLVSYVASNALLVFIGGFLIIFLPLALAQLLAFTVFPLAGTFEGYFNTPVYAAYDMGSAGTGGPLFPAVAANAPYLNNLVFIFYASFWAGSGAVLSFALSLFFRKNRLVSLGVPTAVMLVGGQVLPLLFGGTHGLLYVYYLYPCSAVQGMSPVFFVAAPLAVLTVGAALVVWALRSRKDILL